MRQLPGMYWTEDHGHVFAYAAHDDVTALCVAHSDEYVMAHHDELLPPRRGAAGFDEVADLSDAASEAMSPHLLDGGGVKPARPRRFSIGDLVLRQNLFWSAVHAPGEPIEQGFGRPPRRAVQK